MIQNWTKNLIYKFLASAFLLLSAATLTAQIEVEPAGPLFSPQDLVTNVFLGEGVEVTNITYSGTDNAVGLFTNGTADVGIDRGIIMSSGQAITAASANTAGGTTGNTSGPSSDPDLDPISSGPLNDMARYEITFIPTSDTLQFRYAFASEEYPEYACSGFNDVFGFFISGPDPMGGTYNGLNVALVPDPVDPSGTTFTNIPVTINNVNCNGINPGAGCNYDFCQYYNDNAGSTTLTYDAYLNVFIAQAIVIPCEEYTMKLAVSDVGDAAFDTGVFLEAKSFGTGSLDVEVVTVSLDGTITEGCADAALTLSLPSPVESDYPLDYTIIGDAINGVDYQAVPLDLIIPAGDSTITIPFIGFEDGLDEGTESIGIDIQLDVCTRDTFYIFIRDNELIPPELGPDTTICQGDSVFLDGTLPIPLPDPPTFSNETDMPIVTISNNNPPPPGTQPTLSDIQVFGVQPVTLQEGVIKRICIDVDHIWISDVDVFLVGPNGQFIELTTDNGGSGDDYTQTCFTPLATDPIDFGSQAPPSAAPFTGDWQPEGVWSDLWDIQDPQTNGTWTLQLKDDQSGLNGTLLGWSICFNPVYQINYAWTPSAGLSCDDCPDPIATPDTTTTYYLTASDTYGCEVYDTITINVLETLPPPDVDCSTITDNSIEFCWPPLAGSTGYEVNVDGGGWVTSNGGLCHTVFGLTLEDTVMIEVRGLGQCNGQIDTAICWTPACTPPNGSLVDQANVSCFGFDDGSITVVASGANPPFQYMIADVDTNSTGIFTNLPADTYTVQILDDLGCPQSLQIVVSQPDTMVSQGVLINNAACNGGTDGSATVIVIGGTGPYTFNWDNGAQGDSIATSLAVGDYPVVITDANGCTAVDTVAVTEPPVMSLTITAESVSCAGTADGTATVTVDGGVGPYQYAWDNNTGNQPTQTAVGLAGGTYDVIVTDLNGCQASAQALVIENDPIDLQISATDLSCFQAGDGTATVIASGGTDVFTYEWSDPMNQSTATAVDLPAGTASVLVTDSDGCFTSTQIDLSQPEELVMTAQSTPAFCNGDDNGSIILEVTGGTGPYTFSWSDNAAITDSVRNDLVAALYVAEVTDANGCSTQLIEEVTQPNPIELDFTMNNATCFGENDGFATVNPSGGAGGYTFQWDANAGNQDTQLATSLTAGTYMVTVTDLNDCTATGEVSVGQPDELIGTPSLVDVACFGNSTGSIDIDITGGTGPYSSSWTGPNGYTAGTEDIAVLFAGTYTMIITDANNCTYTDTYIINQPSTGIMSSVTETDTICFQAGSGSVGVSVGGGSGPYTYEWSNNGETTPTISSLDGGTYYVTITDSGNCTFVDTAYVYEAGEIAISLTQTPTLCHDGNDGTAEVTGITVSGQIVDVNDYDLLWSVGGQTGTSVSSLLGGQTYSVTATDAFGCTASQSITIGNPDEIGSRVDMIDDADCFGGNDGSATVNGEGGVAPYTFLWDANANAQTDATAIDLAAGNYSVTITDDNGCFTTNTVTISQPTRIDAQFTSEPVDCFGDSNGAASVVASGGTPDYDYEWSNGRTEDELMDIPAGDYEVTITDANGCTHVDVTTVMTPTELSAVIETSDIDCYEGRNGSLTFVPFGGSAPYTYSLDGENFNGSSTQIGLVAGDYNAIMVDARGCEVDLGMYTINQPDPIEVNLGEDIVIQYGENVQLTPDVQNTQGTTSFNYTLADTISLSCVDCARPIAQPEYTTQYELVVIDENGCIGEDRITVYVEKERLVSVPTGFSPNDDNLNDLLVVHGRQVAEVLLFRVYDRWGDLVYEDREFDANDLSRGWDGNFKGKPMNPGVYVWYVEVEFDDGELGTFKGNSTLLR